MSREDREGTVLMVVREWSGGEVDIWVGAWDLLGRDYPLNMPYEAASRWLSGLAVLPAWKWANGAGWGDSDPFPNCDCWKCKASVASEA